ncbi:N-acetylneuraminate synthase [Butyrivibrio sp. XPD2002]|uniref:N-acetylneuraminate synthase n=1 Tax=Butyrivibrio sp. XPD2002 TaxID=1280665 RepID=UPI00041012AE|nr:N-acetylneuraminate synthase [Butyrivibrio sp. XPD2002]
MDNKNCLIIAEAGVNHNGKLSLAMKLCDAAKEAGADVVKFQTWKTENLLTRNVAQADYQTTNTGIRESQFEMLKKLELSYDDFCAIKMHCDDIGIIFASTADEPESLDFLVELGIPFIKVGSGDIGNISFLRYMGTKHLPVILSTGMSNLADVDISIRALIKGGATDITLLHCTTNYPCPYEDVNLKAMLTLRDAFHLPIGYSDHTIGTDVAVAAAAMGAGVIEKHFTLDTGMEGPDHKASTEPEEFKRLVNSIRNVEVCLGTGVKGPTSAEREISKVVTKRIVAKREITDGDIFLEDNICIKRNDTGVLASQWDIIVGKKASRSFKVDEGIDII